MRNLPLQGSGVTGVQTHISGSDRRGQAHQLLRSCACVPAREMRSIHPFVCKAKGRGRKVTGQVF